MTAAVVGGESWVEAEARTKQEERPMERNERIYRVINAILGMVSPEGAVVKDDWAGLLGGFTGRICAAAFFG